MASCGRVVERAWQFQALSDGEPCISGQVSNKVGSARVIISHQVIEG